MAAAVRRTLSLHAALPISAIAAVRVKFLIAPCVLRLATASVGSASIADPTLAVAKDRKSTRLNSSHVESSYAVFCLKKKKTDGRHPRKSHRQAYTSTMVTR